MDYPADANHCNALARLKPLQKRLPNLFLASKQGLVRLCAVTQSVGLAIRGNPSGGGCLVRRDHIERIISHIARWETCWIKLFILCFPFCGQDLRKLFGGQDLRVFPLSLASLGLNSTAIEQDLPTTCLLGEADLFVKALHDGSLSSGVLVCALNARATWRGRKKKAAAPAIRQAVPRGSGALVCAISAAP